MNRKVPINEKVAEEIHYSFLLLQGCSEQHLEILITENDGVVSREFQLVGQVLLDRMRCPGRLN